jgi:hypothetical protein
MTYESVCDCCMHAFHSSSPALVQRDCPSCGVGLLLGPWPLTRFGPAIEAVAVAFRSADPEDP